MINIEEKQMQSNGLLASVAKASVKTPATKYGPLSFEEFNALLRKKYPNAHLPRKAKRDLYRKYKKELKGQSK